MTVHGPDEFDAPRALSLRDKVADAAFVAAISDFCSAQVRRWSRAEDWHKIHVVRCGVDRAFLDAAVPIARQSRMLLSVGRLSAQKGQLLLIEAFARLRAAGFDATLTIAGDGELRADVERAIRAHGLEPDVTLAGWVDEAELRRLLVAARALVLPSFAEGLPVVLMEALAMERPVIATYVAGTPELVTHGQNGWLVPAGNIDALACAMHAALSEPVERLEGMGAAGARRVRERHDASIEAARLETLLAAASAPPVGEL
jgi:glycosyltransferase involved in cell wall biosynthesis